ncbi:hypothetical protein HQQ81_07380 [Microbacteriaceae bacterium VKM Ac-2854]|nr:hypothetical protein [Microbacteriaceae bacterium VKM Ac-2854]
MNENEFDDAGTRPREAPAAPLVSYPPPLASTVAEAAPVLPGSVPSAAVPPAAVPPAPSRRRVGVWIAGAAAIALAVTIGIGIGSVADGRGATDAATATPKSSPTATTAAEESPWTMEGESAGERVAVPAHRFDTPTEVLPGVIMTVSDPEWFPLDSTWLGGDLASQVLFRVTIENSTSAVLPITPVVGGQSAGADVGIMTSVDPQYTDMLPDLTSVAAGATYSWRAALSVADPDDVAVICYFGDATWGRLPLIFDAVG